jgi:hypothetical protein
VQLFTSLRAGHGGGSFLREARKLLLATVHQESQAGLQRVVAATGSAAQATDAPACSKGDSRVCGN